MSTIADDPRSAAAYSSLIVRNSADAAVGSVDRSHPSARALLGMLGVGEGLLWLGLAYEVTSSPTVTWWLAGLTEQRLLGTSLDPTPREWAHPRGAWQVTVAGTDVVLSLGAGAPLRFRGTSLAAASELFGWEPPPANQPTGDTPNRVLDPQNAVDPNANEDTYVDPALGDADALQGPQPLVHSWQVAEELAGWHMKELGFENVALTPAGVDGGIDVLAEDAVAQVKHYSRSPIGAPAVQQLRGAGVGKGWALFYSLSGYTKSAVDYSNAATVALFQYDEDGVVEPRNKAASHLVDSRSPDGPPDVRAFEAERDVIELMQQYLDTTTSMFFQMAMRGLEGATPGSPRLAVVNVEVDRVKAIVEDLGGHSYPVPQAMDLIDRIIEATRRLDEDVKRLA